METRLHIDDEKQERSLGLEKFLRQWCGQPADKASGCGGLRTNFIDFNKGFLNDLVNRQKTRVRYAAQIGARGIEQIIDSKVLQARLELKRRLDLELWQGDLGQDRV